MSREQRDADPWWCRTCAAFCGPGFAYPKSDHSRHFLAVNAKGQYRADSFDGAKTVVYWMNDPRHADPLCKGAARWHEGNGLTIVPLPAELEREVERFSESQRRSVASRPRKPTLRVVS